MNLLSVYWGAVGCPLLMSRTAPVQVLGFSATDSSLSLLGKEVKRVIFPTAQWVGNTSVKSTCSSSGDR